MDNNELRILVSNLTNIAEECGGHGSLRERVAKVVRPVVEKMNKEKEDVCLLCEAPTDCRSWAEECDELKEDVKFLMAALLAKMACATLGYVITREGAYRHEILGFYTDKTLVQKAAYAAAKAESDDYHAITVGLVLTNKAIEDSTPIYRYVNKRDIGIIKEKNKINEVNRDGAQNTGRRWTVL